MTQIPLADLVTTFTADERPLLAALDRVEAARKKALDTKNTSELEKELQRLGQVATEAVRRIEPLEKTARSVAAELRHLDTAVRSGLVSLTEAAKRYSTLESTLKGQLATLSKSTSGYGDLERQMKAAATEAGRLEAAQKGAAASYKTDDIKRYAVALRDIETAQRAGVTSQRDAQAQLKSLQGAMSQYAGSLKDGSAEQRALQKVMADTAVASGKLIAAQNKLEASFRADYLRLYSGELRQIDTAVKSGVSGFGEAAQRVGQLTTELRSQQAQLGTTGREYDQLGRVLQSAATQQERYQKAAEQAARANDTTELKRYGTELKQLTATLQDTARQYGQIDAAQRAIRYDTSGIRTYRTESEQLARSQQDSVGAFSRVGAELATLKGRLTEAAQSAGTGNQKYADLERLLEGVERATVSAAQAQERSQQAYRSTDISQFAARLREIETAQKSNVISAGQAARAVQQIQGEFKEYAAALGITGRELGTFSRAQLDAGRGADTFASAQERAARAFDAGALRSFVSELQDAVRAYQGGETGAEGFTRAISDSQGRLREYGSTLDKNSSEFTDLNRVLELSERALLEVATAAERSGRSFDGAPLRSYRADLGTVEAAQRDLAQSVGILEAAQRRSQDAFKGAELDRFRGELEAVGRALRDGSGDFDVLLRAAQSTQRGLQDYLGTLDKSAAGHADLSRALEGTGRALTDLGTAAERASKGFATDGIDRFTGELERLDAAQKDLGNGLTDLASASDRLSASFDGSRLTDFRGEIEQLLAAQRDGRATFDETGRAVQEVQTRFRDYISTLNLTAQEQETLNRALDGVDTALTNVGQAAQTAARGFDAAPIRTYTGELSQVEGAGRELEASLSGIDAELTQLGGSFKDAGAGAGVTAGDLQALQNVERELEGATTRLIGEQGKLEAAFRVDALKTFRGDLEQIVTSNKNGFTSFEQTARAVDALQGRMREFATSSSLSANEQRTLATVMGQVESAATRLATAQQRAQDSFQAENVRQQVAALNDLKLALEKGDISQEQFSVSARGIGTALEQSRSGLDNSTRSYASYTGALTKVEGSLASAEGRVQRFGVASGVTAGIGDQLQNVLYTLGPAGEAMGVAMTTAGAGMTGAAGGAKLLNIALAAGVVGAIVAAAVGAVALAKNMYTLDTGMTDVAKTTGFTGTQLNALTKELQGISLNTGTPVAKLLELAGVAGSLGITGVKNVAQFTDTINKLAIATDIVGEEGAKQLAEFVNVTKAAGDSVGESADLVGNVITRLGNSLAATEKPILSMAQRIGGLATTANLSQAEILGISGAFVSLGFTAEGAGTSLQKVVNQIAEAGRSGGPALVSLAKGAGMTTTEFQALAKASPADAFEAYIGGLKEAKDAGVNINPIIRELTGNNETLFGVITRGVGGFDTLKLAMSEASDETIKMSALNVELENRLGSLRGITDLIGQAFAYAGDSLALKLIPHLKTGLTGVLDFSRGVLGLEQTGDRVDSFATGAGAALGQFGKALFTGKNESETFAGSIGLSFNKVGTALDTVQEGFDQAAIRSHEVLRGMLGLSTEASRTAEELRSTGAASLLTADGLVELARDGVTAKEGLLQLSEATGRQGLLAAVDTLSGTLTGAGKQAFVTFAAQAIASGQDINKVADLIEQRYKDARVALLEAQQQAINAELEAAVKRQGEAYAAAGDTQLRALQQTIEADQRLLAQLELRRAKGEQVYQEEIDGVKANIVKNQELEASYKQTYGTFSGEIEAAGLEVTRTTDASNALTREIRALEETEGPRQTAENMTATEVAAGGATDAVSGLAKAQGTFNDLQRLALPQAQTYLANLKDLKATYPELASQLNPLIEATKAHIQTFADTADGADNLSDSFTETGRTAGEMAQNIVTAYQNGSISAITALNSLTVKLTELKAQKTEALASGDYDPADLQALDRDITAVQAIADALNVSLGQVKLPIPEVQALTTALTSLPVPQVQALVAAAVALPIPTVSAFAGELRALPVPVVTAMAGALKQLDVPLPVAQVIDYVGTIRGDLLTAYGEAIDRARLFGEAQNGTGIAAGIAREELQRLIDSGMKPTDEAVKVVSAEFLRLQGILQDQATAAANYTTNLQTVRTAQDALKDSTNLTAEEALKMAAGLEKAGDGTAKLGEEARKAREELLAFAAAKAVLEQTTKELELVGLALTGLSEFASSQGADKGFVTVLAGIGGAATEAAAQIENFSGDMGSQLGAAGAVFGVFADVVRQSFGEDIPTEVEIGLSALETGIQGAAAGFAVGGPIGAAIGGGLGLIFGFFTASAEAANQAAAEEEQRQKEAAEAHAKFLEDWKKREQERIESIREGQRELAKIYDEMRQSSADLTRDLNDARLDNARASGADEAVIFISETILALRDASAAFGVEMGRITQEKNEFITAYLQANPGAGRGEADAAAEAIFGPQRDALKEQFALTGETILLEAEKTAKDLGLSQQEFYEAVFAGNTELLGTMTEGQRQALIQFVETAHEMGIELPAALEEAYAKINGAQTEGGNAVTEGVQKNVESVQTAYGSLNEAWATESARLLEAISKASGDEKARLIQEYDSKKATYQEQASQYEAMLNDLYAKLAEAEGRGGQALADAHAETGRKEQEALGGVFAILRQILGEDANVIIGMIQTTYDKRRAAYVEGSNAAAEGAAQANQGEIDQLNGVFAILRQFLGEDANVIISLIQTTYDRRASAYSTGGADSGNAAKLAAESEAQSVANINQLLRDLFGPDAEAVIAMIHALNKKKQDAYKAGGEGNSEAARLAAESESKSVANINQLLRDLFGPDAEAVIAMIHELNRKKQEAHRTGGAETGAAAQEGGAAEGQGIDQATNTTATALTERDKTLVGLLEKDNISPALRAQAEALRAEFVSGANMTEAEIAAAREKVAAAIQTRDDRIKELIAGGATVADATRQADQELANTFATMGAEVAGGATSGGQLAAQGVSASQNVQLAAIEALKSGLVTSAGGISAQVTPAIVEQHRGLMEAFIQGAQTSGGGIDEAERVQIEKMQGYQTQLEGGAGKLATGATPAITAAHQQMLDAFIKGAQTSGGGIDDAERLQIEKMQAYQSQLTAQAGGLTTGVSPAVLKAHEAISGAFTAGGQVSAGGVTLGGGFIIGALGSRLTAITGQLNKDGTLPGVIASISGDIAGGFTTAGQGESNAIDAAQKLRSGSLTSAVSAMTGILNSSYSGLSNIQSSESAGFVGTISRSGDDESRMFTTQGGSVSSAIDRAGSLLTGGLSTMYSDTTRTLEGGSSGFVANIQGAYDNEQRRFADQSAMLEKQIRESKGDEKAELEAQYDAIKKEHDLKSAEYVKQIGASGGDEQRGIGSAADLTSGALKTMGDDEKTAAYNAYLATKNEHDRMSALYRALMGTSATDERKAAILAAITTGGGLKTMGGDISSSTDSAFKVAQDAFVKYSGLYQDKIKSESDDVQDALEAAARVIANFKFPPTPKPPPIPSGTKSSGDPGDFGLSTTSFFSPSLTDATFSSQIGAFADSGMPDYASATGDMRAYAAAASPLIDLFGSRKTLALTSTQERALTIDLRFGGADFGRMFDKPLAGLERFSNSIWETAKYERETALLNRDTVGRLARGSEPGGTLQWAKRPKRR